MTMKTQSAPTMPPQSAVPSMRRLATLGLLACFGLVFGFGGWAATARLAGAVIAPGTIVVDSNLKKVQHPTGGVVGELHVRNGDRVETGDILARLDDTVTRANLAVVVKSIDELDGRRARLEAERDDIESVTFPEAIAGRAEQDIGVSKIIAGERRLFEARRTARAGQKAQLAQRIVQLEEEIEGLSAQAQSKEKQIGLIRDELKGVSELYAKNLVPLTRLVSLQREEARLEGERGQIIASAAQARGKISEIKLQIIQLDQDLRSEVLKELREIEGKYGELVERKVAAEDQLKRIEIRSPQAGVVHQLEVHTVGGVISPGEVLMLIVPQADALIVEAQVAPQDIDHATVGQEAVVRFSAFNQRTTPELFGTVTRVSADLSKDPQSGLTYYTARVALPNSELARLGSLKLVPGMPAEVHIQTGERTALSYFIKPLADQIARAFKEE